MLDALISLAGSRGWVLNPWTAWACPFLKSEGKKVYQGKVTCQLLQHKGPGRTEQIPTSVIPVVLEVYKHRIHIGLLLHILQYCSQTRDQRENGQCNVRQTQNPERCLLAAEEILLVFPDPSQEMKVAKLVLIDFFLWSQGIIHYWTDTHAMEGAWGEGATL